MNALDHGKVASRPRAWCRSSSTVLGNVLKDFSGHGFDPGGWLEDSRVIIVEVLVSSRVSKGDPVLDCIWFLLCMRLSLFLWLECISFSFELSHDHFCRLLDGCHHLDHRFLVFYLDS